MTTNPKPIISLLPLPASGINSREKIAKELLGAINTLFLAEKPEHATEREAALEGLNLVRNNIEGNYAKLTEIVTNPPADMHPMKLNVIATAQRALTLHVAPEVRDAPATGRTKTCPYHTPTAPQYCQKPLVPALTVS